MPRLLLILDDDRTRLRGFDDTVPRLGKEWVIRAWRDAPSMIAEIDPLLGEAQLISLDHDLYKDSPSDPDPGSGRMIADLLSKRDPVCPVIVHSTNTDAAWGMFNELTSGNWKVELVHHLNQPAWIEELWLPVATKLMLAGRQTNDNLLKVEASMADRVVSTIKEGREELWRAWESLCAARHGENKGFFARNYKACDAVLISIVAGVGFLLYHSIIKNGVPFGWAHFGAVAVALLTVLALFRVGIAFLAIAVPIFFYGCYKFALGALPVEGWTFMYAMARAIEAAICFGIAAYFFSKCAGDKGVNWLARLLLKGGTRRSAGSNGTAA